MHPWQNATSTTSEPRDLFPHVIEFCRSIVRDGRPEYLLIEAGRDDEPIECISNVRRRITAVGGEPAYGWAIWEWHGVMIEAEFHTVWRDGKGALHDVTPRPAPIQRVLFLPDPELNDSGRQINNIRRSLIDDPRVQEFINANDAQFELMNRGERADQLGKVEITAEEAKELDVIQERKTSLGYSILMSSPGRNDLCRCGSGKKWKKCHGR